MEGEPGARHVEGPALILDEAQSVGPNVDALVLLLDRHCRFVEDDRLDLILGDEGSRQVLGTRGEGMVGGDHLRRLAELLLPHAQRRAEVSV